eukprot:scaffold5738_cov61-Phaeocystis_antarctica.AAC.2
MRAPCIRRYAPHARHAGGRHRHDHHGKRRDIRRVRRQEVWRLRAARGRGDQGHAQGGRRGHPRG